jgi:hypothetical protein
VNWFPITAKHLILVLTHYIVLRAWRGASELKRAGASCVGTASAMPARRFWRSLTSLRKTHISEITNASAASGKMSKRAQPQSVRQ